MKAEINSLGRIDVYVYSNDICHVCKNLNHCPLVLSLLNETVFLHYENTAIEHCRLFEHT